MATQLKDVSRRSFLKTSAAAGGALSFYMVLGETGISLLTPAQAQQAASAAKAMSPWVKIAADNTVTILTPGAEMGQGSMTSLPLIVAEEMDADWSKVQLEWCPADVETYGYDNNGRKSMAITGSNAVRRYYAQLRMVGAQVRKVLIANAAAKWNVDPKTLRTEPGAVVNPATGDKLSYGEIAAFGTIPAEFPAVDKAELKKPSEFRYVGKVMARRDIPGKVNGTATFAIDVRLPGMVYATALHSPVQGGEAESWNDADLKKRKGFIQAVKVPNGVAVVADTYETAMLARRALKVTWKAGPKSAQGFDSEHALDKVYLDVHSDANAKVEQLDKRGDADKAFASAAKTYKAGYTAHFAYHAQMEPLNATARFNDAGDHVEVWEDRKSTRLNSIHTDISRMPSSA